MSTHRPYWSEEAYAICPRCGAMAEAADSDNGVTTLGIRCVKCGLTPTNISVWDEESRVQVYTLPLTACRLEEILTWVRATQRNCQIWEGDVLVAHWSPITQYVTYFKGRCGA